MKEILLQLMEEEKVRVITHDFTITLACAYVRTDSSGRGVTELLLESAPLAETSKMAAPTPEINFGRQRNNSSTSNTTLLKRNY